MLHKKVKGREEEVSTLPSVRSGFPEQAQEVRRRLTLCGCAVSESLESKQTASLLLLR